MTENDPNNPVPPASPTPGPGGTPPPASQPLQYSTPGASGYPGPYAGPAPDQDSKTMGMLAHILSIVLGFIGPLIIWLIKKDQSPFVDDQGKESLNFQITCLIAYIICGATCILSFLAIGVWIASVILAVMGGMKANQGIAYRYPFALRLIK